MRISDWSSDVCSSDLHTRLAEEAGLAIGRGIKVDATGRTSDPYIYAIGDCAEYQRGLAAYVTPIMAAARAIAPSALGTMARRSEEHTSELQSLMRISYAVFCLKKKNQKLIDTDNKIV